MSLIDDPSRHDNRHYDYSEDPRSQRHEYAAVVSLIQPSSKVLDLGCGNGSLLEQLRNDKNCTVQGVELSPSGVEACRSKGLDVRQGRIDETLGFGDGAFDYAVCNVTVQMVMYPEVLLKEMARVARRQVVTFPNFAHFSNRLDMLFKGRMPHPHLYGYDWYSTGHIHQLSIHDYETYCEKHGLTIEERVFLGAGAQTSGIKGQLVRRLPNLFSSLGVFLTRSS